MHSADRPGRPDTLLNAHAGPEFRRERTATHDAPHIPGNEGGPVSGWLYLAGLCVTLSGLYAVNFGLEDPTFALITYVLAICGYLTSYLLRVRHISARAFPIPLVICLAAILLVGLSSEQGLRNFLPMSAEEDHFKNLQFVFAWLAIIHSFTLSTDAAVLFACVPCMTMIALVSTTTQENGVQNAFLMFIGSATFLMVHENYLRTQTTTVAGRSRTGSRRLFSGQLQLTALCVIGSLVLANFVAVPIRTVGQTVLFPNALSAFNNPLLKPSRSTGANVSVGERDSIDIGTGPGVESDTPLLRIRCSRALYWRGMTFDYYTGRSFQTTLDSTRLLVPADAVEQILRGRRGDLDLSGEPHPLLRFGLNHLTIPDSPLDLPWEQMRGARPYVQGITVVGGRFSQLYGAASVQDIQAPFHSLRVSDAGRMTPNYYPLTSDSEYRVLSRVPDDTPDHLRAASDSLAEVPPIIRQVYLQRIPKDGPESPRLRDCVLRITRGLHNNYDRAMAIARYIADTCKYNLQAPATPPGRDTVEYFLFESHQGYCDNFAAAMTVMCRYAGIPARLASGFLAGEPQADGAFLVRERDKHLWTEVFFPQIGWVPFDATTDAIDISDHSAGARGHGLSFIAWLSSHGWWPPALLLVVIGLLAYLVQTEAMARMKRRRASDHRDPERPPMNIEIAALYAAAGAALARRGFGRPANMTPDEFLQGMRDHPEAHSQEIVGPLEDLTALYTRFRYGPEVATRRDVQDARAAIEALKQALAQRKRRRVSDFAPPAHRSVERPWR